MAALNLLVFVFCSTIFFHSSDQVAHASDGNGYKAAYVVDFDGIQLGVSERTVVVDEELVATSTHVLSPQGLATLLGEAEYTDVTQMDLSDSKVQTMSSRRRSGKSSDSYSAEFEWDNRTIKFSSGNVIAMPDYGVYDFESWIMLLMLYPGEQQVGSVLSILERENRLRSYSVVQNESDTTDVKGEKIDTRRISLRDVQDKSRGFTAWIVPEFHNLVVKLVKHKESSNLSFTIEEFRQIVASVN